MYCKCMIINLLKNNKKRNLYPARGKPPQLYSAFASSGIPSLKKGGECVTYLTKFPVVFKELVCSKLLTRKGAKIAKLKLYDSEKLYKKRRKTYSCLQNKQY